MQANRTDDIFDYAGKSAVIDDLGLLLKNSKCVMAGKAKFNQEAVFKSIIGPDRELELESLKQSAKKEK